MFDCAEYTLAGLANIKGFSIAEGPLTVLREVLPVVKTESPPAVQLVLAELVMSSFVFPTISQPIIL